jgi:hypothetical protein
MAYIYDLADTWADGATTFTAVKMNVTDTASAAASNLLDLQVGGTSRLRVGKGGNIVSALSANTPAMAVTGYSLTGSDASALLNLAGTWNTTGTPTALLLNVTDTASNANSLLINLQVGGNSKVAVRKDANVILPKTSGLAFTDTTNGTMGNHGIHFFYDGDAIDLAALQVRQSGQTTNLYAFSYAGINLANAWLAWGTGTSAVSQDTILRRDAANTLAQRNGTNAQAFRLYNTFTDASNYERGFMQWASNVLQIGAEAAGTGSNRALALWAGGAARLTVNTDGTISLPASSIINASGTYAAGGGGGGAAIATTGVFIGSGEQVKWSSTAAWSGSIDAGLGRAAANVLRVTNGSTGGGAMQLTEMTAPAAPAADNVRIYAEDDGAGKTRLMARFASGAAVQIAIEP